MIDEETVIGLAMFSEALAMVTGQDDQARTVVIQLFEFLQKLPHTVIRKGDLGRVGIIGEPGDEGCRSQRRRQEGPRTGAGSPC